MKIYDFMYHTTNPMHSGMGTLEAENKTQAKELVQQTFGPGIERTGHSIREIRVEKSVMSRRQFEKQAADRAAGRTQPVNLDDIIKGQG